MKTTKVKTVNAFSYREGHGCLPVVNTNLGPGLPKHQVLYSPVRLYGYNEELEVQLQAPYVVDIKPAGPAPRRVRPSYVTKRRKR